MLVVVAAGLASIPTLALVDRLEERLEKRLAEVRAEVYELRREVRSVLPPLPR